MQGREAKFKSWVVGSLLKAIRVDQVARAMARIALEEGQRWIFGNNALVRMRQK